MPKKPWTLFANTSNENALMKTLDEMKIAIIHEWFTGMRGGEKVVEAFCEIFPQADLYALMHNKGSCSTIIEERGVKTTFIDKLPLKANRYRHYLPLFPVAIEQLDLRKYDLVLSSSHCVAKGVRTAPGALHLCYIHTPMRYVWDMYEDYFGPGRAGFMTRKLVPFFATWLRSWDVSSAARVDAFVANSKHVAKRVRKYYRREADVIYPPVATERFPLAGNKGDYYLMLTALVPYKRVDLAVQAFAKQPDKSLWIIGDGPEKDRLKSQAGDNVRFFDWQADEKLAEFISNCKALIFPGEEDFGIVPVEVQSCGKPVIAFGKGGALETVIGYDGKNELACSGVFFEEQTVEALTEAIRTAENVNWNAGFIHHHAAGFSRERFKTEIKDYIEAALENYGKGHL